MAGKNVVTLSDSSFDTEVLQSATPVMVDFWAEWCGPCKMLGPTIDQLADEYQGRIKIAKLNVDDNSSTASRFAIRGIPAMLIFQGGQVKEQLQGALPKANIAKALDKYVTAAAPLVTH
jgi:thioredoxin 1